MQIYDLDNDIKINENYSIALGNFDGIHLGHMQLLKSVINSSINSNLISSVLIFKEHTRKNSTKLLTNLEQKIEIMKELGIKAVFLKSFDKEFMTLTPKDFVEKFLIEKINAKVIVVGIDYRFGYKASGDTQFLLEYSNANQIKLIIENPVLDENKRISSSEIRNFIEEGKIEKANSLLYKEFTIQGKVIHGNKIGSTLGFPTANLELNDNYIIPKTGVYLTKIKINNTEYNGLTNVGYNPTFSGNTNIKIETFIIDFSEKIYDQTVYITFKKFIRDEIKFDKIEDLIEQMNNDLLIAKSLV